MKNVTFKFVKEDKLIVAEKPSSIAQSRVWLLNTKTLNFNLLFSSGKGDWTYFDKNSDYIFKSNGDGLVLIISPAFETDRGLDFSTFAGKCSFDNASTTYCFVPQVNTFGESGILLNNYLTRKNKTIDELYSFNLWNGEISIPFSGPLANSLIVDAEKLLINKKNLFFINRYDRGVYKIIIPEKSQEKE